MEKQKERHNSVVGKASQEGDKVVIVLRLFDEKLELEVPINWTVNELIANVAKHLNLSRKVWTLFLVSEGGIYSPLSPWATLADCCKGEIRCSYFNLAPNACDG